MKTTITFLLMAVAFVATTDANAQSRSSREERVCPRPSFRSMGDPTLQRRHQSTATCGRLEASRRRGQTGSARGPYRRELSFSRLEIAACSIRRAGPSMAKLASRSWLWKPSMGTTPILKNMPTPRGTIMLMPTTKWSFTVCRKVRRNNLRRLPVLMSLLYWPQALGCEVDKTVYEKRSDVRFRCARVDGG